jgi:hypothetical protein
MAVAATGQYVGAGSTGSGTISLPSPDLQLQPRDVTGDEESTYLLLGDLRPGAGGRSLASSPDAGAEEGLLQLRVWRGEMRREERQVGEVFLVLAPLKIR